MKNLNIAITGASGYLGAYFKNFLTAQGYRVFTLGRKSATTENFIYFELGQQHSLPDLSAIDVLIHCAYDFSLSNYEKIKAVNVDGSIALFQQAKKCGVKKIINISTTSAFAEAESNYGRAKYALEQAAREFNAITIRPGLVFNKNPGGIVGSMSNIIKKFSAAPVIGTGDQLFYPCHVDDLAQLINYFIQQDVSPKEPVVAASTQTITFKELVKTIAATHNKKLWLIPIPYAVIFSGLKMAEWLNLKVGLRSDSVKYMRHYNTKMNFSLLQETDIAFREFNQKTMGC